MDMVKIQKMINKTFYVRNSYAESYEHFIESCKELRYKVIKTYEILNKFVDYFREFVLIKEARRRYKFEMEHRRDKFRIRFIPCTNFEMMRIRYFTGRILEIQKVAVLSSCNENVVSVEVGPFYTKPEENADVSAMTLEVNMHHDGKISYKHYNCTWMDEVIIFILATKYYIPKAIAAINEFIKQIED
mgnify:CR=1 FL=1